MNHKKGLLILILILMIAIIIILIVINNLKKEEKEMEIIKEDNPELTTTLDIRKLNNENEFFTVEKCINQYFENLNENNSDVVYNLLADQYVQQNSINTSNVLQKVYQLKNGFEEFFAKDIYYKEISYDTEYQYYIYGNILEKDYKSIQPIYIIANLDFENQSFNISFSQDVEIDEQNYLNTIEELKKNNTNEFIYVNDENSTHIEVNSFNTFKTGTSNDPYGLDHYLKNYTVMAVYYPDLAYNLLDTEYRNKRFGDIENYKQYTQENKYQLLSATIKEYNVSQKEGFTQYTIMDTNNNYYIFKVTGVMEYTLLCDYYTIDMEEVTDKYDSSNVQEKVAINIQKVISALNSKDYKYVYDKLSEEFKANKFPTLDGFKSYISSKIYGNRSLVLGEFRNEGEIYIYNIQLQGTRASDGDPINMQIIMMLKENRDFVMSFSIE